MRKGVSFEMRTLGRFEMLIGGNFQGGGLLIQSSLGEVRF